MRPDHVGGNEIFIENNSSIPAMASYWELELRRKKWLGHTVEDGRDPGEGMWHVTIEPYSRRTLTFDAQEWFDWGQKALDGRVWFIKIYLVGQKKPIVKRVFPR